MDSFDAPDPVPFDRSEYDEEYDDAYADEYAAEYADEQEYTDAPTPIPSQTVAPTVTATPTPTETAAPTPTPTPAPKEYDGPTPTGKTLKDLAVDLGAPPSLSGLMDDMQEAVLGIIGDVVNPEKSGRRSLADILGYGNRLRGLGALLVLVAVIGIALDTIAGDSLRVVSD